MTDEFLGIFQHLRRKRKPIDLMNVYKGLPVVSSVRIIHVDTRCIMVISDENQLVCLSADYQAYIRHEYFPRHVLARVKSIDLANREVALCDFAYMGPGIGNRKHLRIQPDKLVLSVLQRAGTEESRQGDMVDLSREGLAVFVNRPELPVEFAEIGTQVDVTLRLPVSNPTSSNPEDGRTDAGELRLVGVVVNMQVDAVKGWYRLGLRLAPWHAANETLLQFIDQRQEEILEELKSRYVELMQGQK
jgi:hypothetical protein